jgi:RNA polymerase sigma factor (sigma-70 family)
MVAELSTSTSGPIPAATVADAIAGDTMAFARIVLAQDAAQAAWPIAWRKLGSLRDPDKLRPWLVSIAANEARQMIRRLHRDRIVPIEIADIRSDVADPAWRSADDELVSAIRRLPVEDRTLIALRYVSGFDASEIGPIVGLSASGVRTRLSRIVARLRKEVEQ